MLLPVNFIALSLMADVSAKLIKLWVPVAATEITLNPAVSAESLKDQDANLSCFPLTLTSKIAS